MHGEKRPIGKAPEQLVVSECQSGPAPHLLMGTHTGPSAEDRVQNAAQAPCRRGLLPPAQICALGPTCSAEPLRERGANWNRFCFPSSSPEKRLRLAQRPGHGQDRWQQLSHSRSTPRPQNGAQVDARLLPGLPVGRVSRGQRAGALPQPALNGCAGKEARHERSSYREKTYK